jgi:hypothetical protein
VLAAGGRSADFGKSLVVPVVTAPDEGQAEDRDPGSTRALDRRPDRARIPARRRPGSCRTAQRVGTGDPPAGPVRRDRTPGRPSTAPNPASPSSRARRTGPYSCGARAQSVARQTFRDFTWTIVNDGGDPEEVISILRDAPIDPAGSRWCQPRGKPGHGSRVERRHSGLRQRLHRDPRRRRQLVPRFPRKNGRLPRQPGGRPLRRRDDAQHYVSEEIRGDRVIEHETRPYNDWVRNVQLSEMACGNFFPPIAFLFRRAVLDRIGGFNEALPVLGDWFFNLEFCWRTTSPSCPKRWRAITTGTGATRPGRLREFGHRRRVETRGIRRHRAQRLSPPAWRPGGRGRVLRDGLCHQRSAQPHRPERGTTQGLPPARPMKGCDDRLWCVRELNAALSRRGLWRRIRRGPPSPPISAGSTWHGA